MMKISNVDRLIEKTREMAINFELKPGARVNESVLSRELGASRTPLREALNRLVAEGFLTFQTGKGFFCRALDPKRIMDLYETRVAIEVETARLVCLRTSDDDLAGLRAYLDRIEPDYLKCVDGGELVHRDEEFHIHLARLSQNDELQRLLENLNGRIRYVRAIGLKTIRTTALGGPTETRLWAHRFILDAMIDRDLETAVTAMRSHIERHWEDATEAVRIAYAQIYVPDDIHRTSNREMT
jgi:DNA-binding GntR family transcriptional regulator